MFYRRKILLALLETFGGSLHTLDCQKLLLLFCLRRGKNYYDFFPHTYGNFSFILAQDHNRLIDLGLLSAQNDFQITGNCSYIDQLQATDRVALHTLVSEVGSLRGEALLRKVASEVPHYAYRSQFMMQLPALAEYEPTHLSWNTPHTPAFFTIGYEGVSIDAYLDLLVSNNVAALIDVRKNPISMKYGFSKKKLSHFLSEAGITYIHLAELGIPSNLRHELHDEADYRKLFDFYSAQILPSQLENLNKLKRIANEYKRVAITCFEANHYCCHRHRITEYLGNESDFNLPIIHLRSQDACAVSQKSKTDHNGLLDENTLYSSV